MNMKLVKRMLAVTLSAALMVTPITAGATTQSSGGSSNASTATSSTSTSTSTSSGDTSVSTPAPLAQETSTFTAGGATLKSQVNGAYSLSTGAIKGVAVRLGTAGIAAIPGSGISGNEKAYVRAYGITAAKSPAAFATFNSVAASLGGTVLGAINFDLGKLAGKNFSLLPAGVLVPVTLAIPAAGVGKNCVVVKVVSGGAYEVLQDTDENPATITANFSGGSAAYAVVAIG